MGSNDGSPTGRARARSAGAVRLLLSRDLLGVLAVACVAGASQTMLRPLVAPYATALGAGPLLASMIVAVLSLPGLVLGMPAGAATDRFGYRGVLTSGGLLVAVGAIMLALLSSYPALFASILLLGLGLLAIALAAQGAATQPGEHGLDTRRIAAYGSFILVGQLIGPTLGGVLTDAGGYAAAFVGLAGLGVASAALGLTTPGRRAAGGDNPAAPDVDGAQPVGDEQARTAVDPPESSHARAHPAVDHGADPGNRRGWTSPYRRGAALLSVPGIAGAAAASALGSALVNLRTSFLPLYLIEIEWSASAIGLVLSAASGGALLSRAIFPLVERRIRAVHLFGATLAGGGLCLALAAAGLGTFTIVVAITLSGSLVGAVNPSSLTLLSRLVSEQHRGTALGVRVTGNRTAQGVAPLTFGALAAVAGVQAALVMLGAAVVMATALVTRSLGRLASR